MMDKDALIKEYFAERLIRGDGLDGHPFVTISREAGAGGHTFAELLLRRINEQSWNKSLTGWQIFDRQLCDIIAQDPKLRVLIGSLLTEEYHSEIQELLTALVGGPAHQFVLYKKTFELLHMLGAIGKVILIGRGSVCATRKHPAGVHIRLTAPESARLENLMSRFDFDRREARQWMKRQDRARERLVQDYFGKDIADPALYDAVYDTSVTPTDAIAGEILGFIEEKRRIAPPIRSRNRT